MATGWTDGLSQDYDKKLARWFSSRLDSRYLVAKQFQKGSEMKELYITEADCNKAGFSLFYSIRSDSETAENARKIGAVDDLLEFAKLIVNGDGHSLREIMQQGKAAIAKATGETK